MQRCLSQFRKRLLLLGISVTLRVSSTAQGLPTELPLPPGVTIARVDHMDFGQDEFSYPSKEWPRMPRHKGAR
jgi:hypothetical protein